MNKLKNVLILVIVLALATSFTGCQKKEGSSKENWPSEAITIICPWAVGGLADQVNRVMSEYGEEQFGQPLLADNILGSGGTVALTEYLKEKPNSHKLIFASEGNFAITPLTSEIEYKQEDFIPVIRIYSSTFVLSANPETGVDSFQALEEYVKDNVVEVATNGTISSEAMQCAGLLNEMGAEFKIVPYEGANEALTAAVSGEVDFAVTHASLAKEYVKSGDIYPVIAFDEKKLVDEVYNLDCVEDYGYDTWMTNTCNVMMRAGTDQEIVDKVYNGLLAILENEEFLATAESIGLNIDPANGEEINAFIEDCTEKAKKYAELLK